MNDILSLPELRVQGNGSIVAVIGLDVDGVRAALDRNIPEFRDERGSDALSPALLMDREVVDVDLATGLLELGENVRRKAADGDSAIEGCDCNECVASKQSMQVAVVWLSTQVSLPIGEGGAKERQQGAKFSDVGGAESAGRCGLSHARAEWQYMLSPNG